MNGAPVRQPEDKAKPAVGANLRRVLFLLFAVTVAVLLWLGLRQRHSEFRWDLFRSTFAETNWGWLLVSVVLVLLTYFGRAIRWQVMLRPLRPDCSLSGLFRATVIGFTAIVLFGRAGELVRPYLIASREKVPFSSQLAAWLLERIYDLLSVLLLFGFALSRISASSGKVGPSIQWVLETGGHIVGILCTICMLLLVVFGVFPHIAETRLIDALSVLPDRLKGRVQELVRAFLAGTSSTRRGSFVLLLIIYTFAEWMLIVGCFLSLFRAFPATASLGFLDSMIVVGFVAFGSAVQIPGIGGGMQVSTILVLTELFGVPLEVASGMAILIWVITFVIVVPFGLVLALRDGLELRKLSSAKQLESS